MAIKLNGSYAGANASAAALASIEAEIISAHDSLHAGTGKGSDFLGWVDLPVTADI